MKYILTLLTVVFWGTFSFALKPDKVYRSHPDSFNLNFESHLVETPDGATLKTWLLKPAQISNGNTLIISYGDAGNMSYWLSQAAILNQRGFTMVLFDYRGFGESSDFAINPNQLYYNEFATDLKSVIQWTKQHVQSNKLGIWALSMGTIMSTLATETESVDFLIGEGFVSNLNHIKDRLFELKQKELELPDNNANYENLIRNIQFPVLLFAGNQDQITTWEDSKRLANQRNNRKLVRYDGNHLQGFQVMSQTFFGENYVVAMENFIAGI